MRNNLEQIKRIKALADTGIKYAQTEYDQERYQELRVISLDLLSSISDQPIDVLQDFFMPEKDYPTPKVDIRGFVLNENNEVLMVKEHLDGKWALPGGWGEIGFTPSEVIVKEIQEETGLNTNVSRLLAVYDKRCHPHPPQPFYVYKMVFLCKVDSGKLRSTFDIEDVNWFAFDKIPDLSEDRILNSQIRQLYDLAYSENQTVHFD